MSEQESIPRWAREELGLRRAMKQWIERSISVQRNIPYRGGKVGHDEGSFTASWTGYYLLTGEVKVLQFMRWLRDQYRAYSERHQVHGYDDWGEVHHQTEHYTIFLARLWHLDRSDSLVVSMLEDAAHHAGNWADGVPDWYDWDTQRFKSWSMGTRLVQDYPPYDFNVPDHFKVLQIALLAYLATGRGRYMDLCRDYANAWVDLVLEADRERLPAVLFAEERSRAEREALYAKAQVPVVSLHYDADRTKRVELYVASGALELLLDLYSLTAEERYVAAVQQMLPSVVTALADPAAEIPAALLHKYRQMTGDTSHDAAIMEQVTGTEEENPAHMVLLSGIDHERDPIVGRIGRRRDQIRWGYQQSEGSIHMESSPSPACLMLGYTISSDLGLAERALAKARRRMELAAFVLRDGREHGCGAHSVHAVAAGHGRATGAGCVTTTLYPFALGAFRYAGVDEPRIRYAGEDGQNGLPEGIAARWIPGSKEIELCSVRDSATAVEVAPAIATGGTRQAAAETGKRITVPAGGLARVQLGR